ncbi:MAG: sulfatase-like hydrolase/transferase [Acidobacteriota bacterium]|nr:sulfatase-like hydrolase/transferase [Acidobacteriota bacterium]
MTSSPDIAAGRQLTPGPATVAAQAIVAAAAFMLGSAASYFQNIDEFTFSLTELAPYLLAITLVLAALLFAMAWLVSALLPSSRYWLIPYVAVTAWLQGAFNVPAYGPFDGSAIPWAAFAGQHVKDAGVLLAAGAAMYLLRRHVRAHPLLLPAALVFIQLSSAVAAARPVQSMPASHAPGNEIYRFSTSENVILVVLDAFQTDALQEILNRRPEFRDALKGFTYYPNTVGFHPTTAGSVPALFIGEHYRNEQPVVDFRRLIFSTRSIVSDFGEKDFQIDIISRGGFPAPREGRRWVSQRVLAEHLAISWRNTLEQAVVVAESTLFRSSPQALRMVLYGRGVWWLSSQVFRRYPQNSRHRSDLQIVEQMDARAYASGEQPVFKFVHFYTPHLPIVLDAHLEPVSRPFSRAAYVDQAEASIRLVLRFLSTLQRIGVYDASRIVVVGDHGRAGVTVKSELFESLGRDEGEPNGELARIMSGGLPLFLAKAEKATGPLRVDHAPVSLADVAPTLAKPASNRFGGYSVFADTIPADRRREFLYYHWDDLGWNAAYLDPMTVYTVDGHAWLRSSWKAGRTLVRPVTGSD